MIFDPLYLLVIGIGMGLSLYASSITKGRFRKYSQYTTRSRLTGADIARNILQDNNIHDVSIERVAGELSDHYDPRTKTLGLAKRFMIRTAWLLLEWLLTRLVMRFSMLSLTPFSDSAPSGYQWQTWVADYQ